MGKIGKFHLMAENSRTRRPMILKLGVKHQAIELYKVYINHDPGMTLTHFMTRSTLCTYLRSQVSVYRTIGPLVPLFGEI